MITFAQKPDDGVKVTLREYDSEGSLEHEANMAKVGVVMKDGMFINAMTRVREFDSGATRDQDRTKYDYEGFLSPLVLRRFAAYMHHHRIQTDDTLRASDNWQKGIPRASYMKSLWRHMMTVWGHHREVPAADCEGMEEALCGVIFNAQGYLHEIMKEKRASVPLDLDLF